MATYGELLRGALKARGMSRRKLSFLIAEHDGIQQNSAYRVIGKWLSDQEQPNPERAQFVAEILETPELAATRPRRLLLRGVLEIVERHQETLEELTRRVEACEHAIEAAQQRQGEA